MLQRVQVGVVLFCIVLRMAALSADAESLESFQDRIREHIAEVTQEAKQDTTVTEYIRTRYDPNVGEDFDVSSGSYKSHPTREQSPIWQDAWVKEDTEVILSDFIECLDLRIIGRCSSCRRRPRILVEFWWPEAGFETNDYCQGSMMDIASPLSAGPSANHSAAGCFVGDAFKKAKDELILGQYTSQIQGSAGGCGGGTSCGRSGGGACGGESSCGEQNTSCGGGSSCNSGAGIPQGLRDDPNWGRSRTISSAGQFHEAHAYRTFHDLITARAGSRCIRRCMPTPADRFPAHASELPLTHMPLWRFPELSRQVPEMHSRQYQELYGELPELALSVGKAHYDTSMSPMLPRNEAPFGGQLGAQSSICASYRAASDFFSHRGRLPISDATNQLIQEGSDSELYRRLCFPQSVGQLYPVTGFIPSASSKTSPIGAGRRLWEIASADHWKTKNRFNYFNDYNTRNLYRDRRGNTHIANRKPDKLQRIFPSPSKCFKMKDIDELDTRLFPHAMGIKALTSDEQRGESRYVHWNRRRACISSRASCCEWREE